MTYEPISDEQYEKDGGTDSGRDSLNFVPEQHHVSALDTPTPHDPAGAKAAAQEVQETDSHESRQARRGATMALEGGSLKGDSLPFNPSTGLHSTGHNFKAEFEGALRYSGGVRQGSEWCSDAAPGVQRIIVDHTETLAKLSKPDEGKGLQNQGSGRTFETQRRSHWSRG